MKQKRKWSLRKKIIGIGLLIAVPILVVRYREQVFMGLFVIIYSCIRVVPLVQPLGGQYAGSYYVEHINASTNMLDEDEYIHLWECDTPIGGLLYRYSLEDGASVLLAGGYYAVWDYVLDGDLVYYKGRDGCHVRNLQTKETWQIAEDDPRYEKLQADFAWDAYSEDIWEMCEKAENALGERGYADLGVYASHFAWSDGVYVGIVQVPLNSYYSDTRLKQGDLRYDILFSYDPTADRCEILYQSKNNRTRIIGYQDGNVYLYQRDRIFCKNLETGKQEILAWLPKSLTYTFDWWEDQLIVIDHETNELVEVLEI